MDSRLTSIFYSTCGLLQDDATLSNIKKLEKKINRLIMDEAIDRHIKSKVTWIAHGDNNSKSFHNFASYQKNRNIIWDFNGDNGNRIHTFGDLEISGVSSTKNLFTFLRRNNLNSIMRIIQSFPRLVSPKVDEYFLMEFNKK